MVHSIFYSEICIINPENVPAKGPVIFAPNHQNALMDALAILLLVDKQPVFMARADIFKKKTVGRILNFLKIIPVFRIRDGVDSLSNNTESFGIALRALGYGQAVGIMPEGNHGDKQVLRPLKKGIARFALNAQENFGKTIPVKLVPVGIEYSHYTAFRSKLLVIFGKPIDVTEFLDEYKVNPQVAYNSLRERLASEMKKNMINISNSDYYDAIANIKEIYADRLRQKQGLEDGFYFRFLAEKQITEKLVSVANENPSFLIDFNFKVSEYLTKLKKLGLADWVINSEKPDKKTLLFDISRYLVFLPFYLFAIAVHYIPYKVCDFVANGAKDNQFRSSIKLVLIAFLFPVYYLLFLVLPFPLITKLILLLPMPILGVLSFDYFMGLKNQWTKFKYFRMLRQNNNELAGLKQLKEKIITTLDHLF